MTGQQPLPARALQLSNHPGLHIHLVPGEEELSPEWSHGQISGCPRGRAAN
jgi:hypothetical protein